MFFRAKLAQTYGWTHHYIEELEYGVALEYYSAITPIEGQMQLVQMNIADYPKMKKSARTDFYKGIRKLSYPESMQKQTSFEDFAKEHGLV